jgi:hypothetical protein
VFITFFLSIVMGVSMAVPLVWLPSYWVGMGNDAAAAGTPPPAQLAGAAAAALALALPSVLLHTVQLPVEALLAAYVCWLLSLGLGMPLLGWVTGWLARLCPAGPVSALASPPKAKALVTGVHLAAAKLYTFLAGALVLHHVLVVVQFVKAGAPAADFRALLANRHIPAWQASYFLLLDTLGLLLAAAAFVCMEQGLGAGLGLLCRAVVVGPGTALAMYAAAREERLAALLGGPGRGGAKKAA